MGTRGIEIVTMDVNRVLELLNKAFANGRHTPSPACTTMTLLWR